VKTIEREVAELEGVSAVSADAASKKVKIDWDESRTDWSAIEELLQEIHYPPAQ
jgi:copper chaperone CopZ